MKFIHYSVLEISQFQNLKNQPTAHVKKNVSEFRSKHDK